MGELDKLKGDLIGHPVSYTSKGVQGCFICDKMNEVAERNDAPQIKQAEYDGGDEIIFRASKKSRNHEHGEDDRYHVTKTYHIRHNGEYGRDFGLEGTSRYHDVLATAVVEKRGVDFGRIRTEELNMEYEPDVEEEALTFADIEVFRYRGPKSGKPENKSIDEIEEAPEPSYDIPGLPGFWSEERQKKVAEWIRKNQS
jgi:hypothetical protein